jgi:hypothetical protein
MPRRARRPDPAPLETDDSKVVMVGTGLWAAGLVVLLVLRVADVAEVRDWWLGMCLYGIALGLFGVLYVRRRADAAPRDGSPRR